MGEQQNGRKFCKMLYYKHCKLLANKITYQYNWPCYQDVEGRVLRQQDDNRSVEIREKLSSATMVEEA